MGDGKQPVESEQRPTRIRWEIFAVSLATSAILYLHRYSFAIIKPSLAAEWNLNNSELGQFDSTFALSYSLFQVPLAMGADAVGVRLVLTLLIVAWGIGLSVLAIAPSSRWVLAAQTLFGAGQSAVYACLTRISRAWYPQSVRSTMQGTVNVLAGRLGALAASLLVSTLLLGMFDLPWRLAIGILAAMAAVLAVTVAVVLRNDPSQHARVNLAERDLIARAPTADGASAGSTSVEPTAKAGGCDAMPAVSSRPQWTQGATLWIVIGLAFQQILSTFADNIYSNWLPQFLSQVHGLKFKEMGIYWTLPLLGGAVAGFVGGWLNDRLVARTGQRIRSRVVVAVAGKGLAGVVMLAALTQFDNPYMFCGSLFFVKALSDWSLVSSLGLVTDVGGRTTASLFAVINTIAGIGQVTAPLLYGHVADHYGWRPVFQIVAAAYGLCAAAWVGIGLVKSTQA